MAPQEQQADLECKCQFPHLIYHQEKKVLLVKMTGVKTGVEKTPGHKIRKCSINSQRQKPAWQLEQIEGILSIGINNRAMRERFNICSIVAKDA